MAIPISYNLRSLRARWPSTVVAVLGIAGTVGVFVAMMSLAKGFKSTLVASGSPHNALIRRAGSTSEMDSGFDLAQVRIVQDAKGIAHDSDGPLVSPEVVVVAAFPLKSTGTDANVQVRGVSPIVLKVRDQVKIVQGRFFRPGLNELIVGNNVDKAYAGFGLGQTVLFGGGRWTVVGVFDAGGSAFDSEIWCDAAVLNDVYKRPTNIYQSATARLTSNGALTDLKDTLSADPRVTVQADREIEYYEKESRVVTTLITVLGTLVAGVMGIGAIFGALNTMYSAVAERGREIATMRALGFGSASVVLSFVFEALCIALIGGIIGCIGVLPLNGFTTGTMNWQTFSHLAFAFKITPVLMAVGVIFALTMGILGGVPPAVRAARANVATALREL
ncbi:MAG TPA: ABC transporter permease [Terriglobales bacterium]|jgi:putative ABC transport system permease protein|nr:ABC transporter permease [Terriglobales bacterium]